MIASLTDALHWYESVRLLTRTISRFADRYWGELPWAGILGRDNSLSRLDPVDLAARAQRILDDLDDLGVLLLFSVFEAIVRGQVLEEIDLELPKLAHLLVRQAALSARDAAEHSSFYRVLDSYKSADANLVEEVNQVRRYRNWVAHGRRTTPPDAVRPRAAYDRLQRFLDRFPPPSPAP